MKTLIAADNTWALLALMVSWVAVSIWAEQRYRWVSRISGPIVVMLGAVLFSNTGLIPIDAPVYDTVWKYVVPVAIPLLLFRANIFTILRDSGPMFLVFHFSAVGTMVGAAVAVLVLRQDVPHAPEVAGIMTGSYTGGSVNFVALSAAFDPDKKWEGLLNSLIVADNLVMAIVFLFCFAMVGMKFFRRFFPTPYDDAARAALANGDGSPSHAASYWKPKPIGLRDIAVALAIAVSVAGISCQIADAFQASEMGEGPKFFLGNQYLILTTLCVVGASLFPRFLQGVAGAEELGTYMLYLFFFVIGVPADVVKIFKEVPVLFEFCGIMAAFNLLVTLLLGKLFRRNLEEVALACNATLGGAPSAGAMAIAKGWRPLVVPAFLVGIWGYVVGTYLGIAVGRGLQGLLGGD